MRDRPFIPASEQIRPYGDIIAERRELDPLQRSHGDMIERIAELEAEAAGLTDPQAKAAKQCEAEALRCALDELLARHP